MAVNYSTRNRVSNLSQSNSPQSTVSSIESNTPSSSKLNKRRRASLNISIDTSKNIILQQPTRRSTRTRYQAIPLHYSPSSDYRRKKQSMLVDSTGHKLSKSIKNISSSARDHSYDSDYNNTQHSPRSTVLHTPLNELTLSSHSQDTTMRTFDTAQYMTTTSNATSASDTTPIHTIGTDTLDTELSSKQ